MVETLEQSEAVVTPAPVPTAAPMTAFIPVAPVKPSGLKMVEKNYLGPIGSIIGGAGKLTVSIVKDLTKLAWFTGKNTTKLVAGTTVVAGKLAGKVAIEGTKGAIAVTHGAGKITYHVAKTGATVAVNHPAQTAGVVGAAYLAHKIHQIRNDNKGDDKVVNINIGIDKKKIEKTQFID